MSAGRLFQTRGPATGKARVPIFDSLNGGTTRRCHQSEETVYQADRRHEQQVHDTQRPTPISFEYLGTLNSSAVALISALGRKINTKPNDLRESTFLFQCLAITLQRFNSVLLPDSFVCDLEK